MRLRRKMVWGKREEESSFIFRLHILFLYNFLSYIQIDIIKKVFSVGKKIFSAASLHAQLSQSITLSVRSVARSKVLRVVLSPIALCRVRVCYEQLSVSSWALQWKIIKFIAKVVINKWNSKWWSSDHWDCERAVTERITGSAMCKLVIMVLILLTLLCNYLMIVCYKCL